MNLFRGFYWSPSDASKTEDWDTLVQSRANGVNYQDAAT